MIFIPIALALAAGIHAAPATPSNNNIERSTEPTRFQLCQEAENCETYEDGTGKTKIRFKRDMGPGSAYFENHAHLSKRDGEEVTTQVSISDKTLNWGCNTSPGDAIYGIKELCPPGSGTCQSRDDDKIDFPIQVVEKKYAVIDDDVLHFTAEGEYPIWSQSAFLEGVKAVANADVQVEKDLAFLSAMPSTRGIPIRLTDGQIPDHCDQITQTVSIDIQRHVGGAMQGFIHVNIAAESEEKAGLCGSTKGLLGIMGALSGAVPVVGAGIAAVFGSITASCDL